jgi:hypothetical protein
MEQNMTATVKQIPKALTPTKEDAMTMHRATVKGRDVLVTVPENDHSVEEVIEAAWALLNRLDHMTSREFSRGGERVERERLRKALERAEG